ncbi:hypothetical protein P879_06997 [Paragonimus westermani]|uniref:Suppressor of G2 allele of SKP1 n=1 Tax=Paragonimus westermani TaxID=34504 RepID=A0A8T0D6K5_9TREM|nr:hypothetical protein P879_06997 [Paragonimus westermani]
MDLKFDWYQSDREVCINCFRKNLNASDVKVSFEAQDVSIFLLAPSGDELLRRFHLAHPVSPEHCSYRVSPVKIELRLGKLTETKWNELELEVSQDGIKDGASPNDGVAKIAHTYPSSSKVAHDWSKLEKEAAEIEDDGDPLNKLFQNIYADASDETRRAMIKSFTESGGTVLSTNWKEVGKEKVEMKPPDGMEYKKYEI